MCWAEGGSRGPGICSVSDSFRGKTKGTIAEIAEANRAEYAWRVKMEGAAEVTHILTLWSHSADRRRSTSRTRPLELP